MAQHYTVLGRCSVFAVIVQLKRRRAQKQARKLSNTLFHQYQNLLEQKPTIQIAHCFQWEIQVLLSHRIFIMFRVELPSVEILP